MEAITEHVREPRSRRTRPRQQAQKSLAESPPSLPTSSQKKKKRRKETTSAEYYLVKEILDEKIEAGEISYLIDWEDNAETGESYTPTWEPYDNVNREAINEWNARNIQAKKRKEDQHSLQESILQPPSSLDSYPDNQPIRTAKRQRDSRPQSRPSLSLPTPKKPRRAGTVETARFQSVSQETIESQGKAKEIKDSYEEDQSLSDESGRIRVEIQAEEGFDRDAYTKVSVASSIPSQLSQNSRSIHTSSESQLKTPTPRPFLWDSDEEDDRVPIVPNSQDLPESSSYKPTQTPTSRTGATTGPNTRTGTEELPTPASLLRFSPPSLRSLGLNYRHSEPPSFPSRTRYLQDESGATSSQVGRSTRPSTGRQHFSSSVEDSQDIIQLPRSGAAQPVKGPVLLESSRAGRRSPKVSRSLDIPTSSENDFRALARGTWSQQAPHSLSQVQSHQPSHSGSNESSLQFQTQVSVESQDERGSQIASHHVQRSHELVPNRQPILSERIQSKTLGPKPQPARSITPSQRLISSLEATWSAAKLLSASPRPDTQEDHNALEQNQRSSLSHTQNTASHLPTTPSTLSHIDVNSQISSSKSQDRVWSDQEAAPNLKGRHRRLGQPSENVLPSIEHFDTISSPAPSRPSPPLSDTREASALYELSTPTKARMDDQEPREMSTAEKLKLARTAAAEKKMAEQRAARAASTSAIPHTPPPPVNQMLPLRETALEAPPALTDSAPSPKASPDRGSPTKGLQLLPLGDNVFTIPLPMVSLARDIYDQEITNYQPQRRSFLNDEEIDTRLVEEIDTMIERLKMICDHQDLVDADSATQQMEPDHRQARWAENISTKCIFLAEFFNSLRSIDTHIVVLVRPGRMMGILEALFRTNRHRYSRPDQPPNQSGQGLLRISLLPSDIVGIRIEPASLVIAFDSTFVKEPAVESLRTDPRNGNRLAPRVHLVITHSIEHLELCIKKNMNRLDRKAILVNALSHTRQEVGILAPDYPSPDAAAKSIADFIAEGASSEWPIPPMPDIEGIEPIPETTAEENSNNVQFSGSTTQSYDMSSSTPPQSAFKRPLLEEEDSESSKRQRMTPVGGVSSCSIEASRINETILNSKSQSNQEAMHTREVVTKAYALDVEEDQVSSLLKKITELESQLRAKEATEAELRQFNQSLEARCKDYESSIEKIQPKYQEALNERGQAEHDIKECLERETSMRQKLEARTNELTKLREEKAALDAKFTTTRTALASSSIPEVAELQKLKDELSAAKLENEKSQRRVASAQNDMDFMRTNYQQASSSAAEIHKELEELKATNAILTRKASDNAVEIHRIQASSEIKQLSQRISELEGEKAECERELEKKSEELRTLLNGRRTTRGTSVPPRSPRMGTMSPGQSSRPMARVLSGMNTGSRGNSPAPSGAESGFRGPGTIGDVLFIPMGGVNRFGSHLN